MIDFKLTLKIEKPQAEKHLKEKLLKLNDL